MSIAETIFHQIFLNKEILDYFGANSLKVVVLAGVLVLLWPMMCRAAPSVRSFVVRLTLVAIFLLPVLSFMVPIFKISLFDSLTSPWRTTTIEVSSIYRESAKTLPESLMQFPWTAWVFIVWLAGVAVMLSWLGIGRLYISRIIRAADSVKDPLILNHIKDVGGAMGVRSQPRLYQSNEIEVPFVLGIFRPIMVIPAAVAGWPSGDIRMMLSHEMAHLKRHDLIWLIVGSLATALHWFNPFVWALRRKLTIEADKACDDYVLAAGTAPVDYAERLINMVGSINRNRAAPEYGAGLAYKSRLEERVMSILRSGKHSLRVGRSPAVLIIFLSSLFVFPLAGLQLYADDIPEPPVEPPVETPEANTPETPELPAPDEFVPLTAMPEMIEQIPANYPEEAKVDGVEGEVWIKSLVDRDGTVRKALVTQTSGYDMFDQAAVEAALECRFKPGELNGEPVATWVTYQVQFRLEEKDTSD